MNTNQHQFRVLPLGALLFALGLLTACSVLPEPQADPVRYFTLGGGTAGAPAADALIVRPVRLAGHLRNRNVAVRVSENEVVYLEGARWAESLDEAITAVLRNRLRQIGGGSVTVQIQRCELVRSAGNTVQLAATYVVSPPGGGVDKPGAFTATPRAWTGGDHGELVGLLQAAVNELADAIASAAEAK